MSEDREEALALFERLYDEFNAIGDVRYQMRSACRKIQEAARLARRSGLLVPYLRACLQIADKTEDLLDPHLGQETAIEMVALLEHEDRARLIQPDLDDAEYAETIVWMLPCVYDKLAVHTARMQGYNSAGMQACINAGLEVCRRTGKLQCLTCFREYATSVYLSADDLDMALHSARQVAGIAEDSPVNFRRWSGARDEALVLLLQGRLTAAGEAAARALDRAGIYYNSEVARRESSLLIDTIRLLAGQIDRSPEAPTERDVAPGEAPALELAWDLHDALVAAAAGDFDRSQQLLRPWDQKLLSTQCLDDWFEVRLRLIALQRLSGESRTQQRLADQLQDKARAANDWLTLRRLGRLMDPAEPETPFPFAETPDLGPWSPPRKAMAAPADAEAAPAESTESTESAEPQAAPPPPATPWAEHFVPLARRLAESRDDDDARRSIAAELLAIQPDQITVPYDAGWAMHLMQFVIDSGISLREVWNWAESVAGRHPTDARTLNAQATLGHRIIQFDSEMQSLIDDPRIEALYQKSLDLDPTLPRNFARAATYYLDHQRYDDAERCLARAFRLDRTNGAVAIQLAELYEQSDRDRDALAVLDLALREGSDEPQVAWQAALLAFRLSQYEALLTYLERFEQQSPGEPWVHYYRAIAWLEQETPARAREALAEERRRNPTQTFQVEILEACAAAAEGQVDEFRGRLQQVLALRPRDAGYLTSGGFQSLYQRLWSASRMLPESEPLRRELVDRLLQTGLTPDEFFDQSPPAGEASEGVDFFRVLVRQPVDDDWADSCRCLPGQEEWSEYQILWGVLARNEAEARRLVAPLQSRCESSPCEFVRIIPEGESYTEVPRVVWQGVRQPPRSAESGPQD